MFSFFKKAETKTQQEITGFKRSTEDLLSTLVQQATSLSYVIKSLPNEAAAEADVAIFHLMEGAKLLAASIKYDIITGLGKVYVDVIADFKKAEADAAKDIADVREKFDAAGADIKDAVTGVESDAKKDVVAVKADLVSAIKKL